MLGHFLTYLAEPLPASARLAVLRLDLLAFIAIVMVVMALPNLRRIFGRVGVIRRVFGHGVSLPKVEYGEDRLLRRNSRIRQDGAALLLRGVRRFGQLAARLYLLSIIIAVPAASVELAACVVWSDEGRKPKAESVNVLILENVRISHITLEPEAFPFSIHAATEKQFFISERTAALFGLAPSGDDLACPFTIKFLRWNDRSGWPPFKQKVRGKFDDLCWSPSDVLKAEGNNVGKVHFVYSDTVYIHRANCSDRVAFDRDLVAFHDNVEVGNFDGKQRAFGNAGLPNGGIGGLFGRVSGDARILVSAQQKIALPSGNSDERRVENGKPPSVIRDSFIGSRLGALAFGALAGLTFCALMMRRLR